MAQGVEQVATLVRELARRRRGVARRGPRRRRSRALGENLREHKLRRLSAKTIALADAARGARRARSISIAYAELIGDLLLTARKLEKHLAGEALEDRHVEELIGKTWTKKDRAPVSGLDLVEYAFLQRETPDDFVIRESRFVDVGERRALQREADPARRSWPSARRRSRATPASSCAAPAAACIPATRRAAPTSSAPATASGSTTAALERLAERAVPSVKQAIAALAEHKKDVFAPETLPVAIACDMVIADRGRLQLVDKDGAAVFLPDDEGAGRSARDRARAASRSRS